MVHVNETNAILVREYLFAVTMLLISQTYDRRFQWSFAMVVCMVVSTCMCIAIRNDHKLRHLQRAVHATSFITDHGSSDARGSAAAICGMDCLERLPY
jgi:hypothetical protein